MKQKHKLFLFGFLIFQISCSPVVTTNISKTYPTLNYKDEVLVISKDDVEPESYEFLGFVTVGEDGGSENCTFDIVVNLARLEARKVGGNAIRIMRHNPPKPFNSQCHVIKADILKIEDINSYKEFHQKNNSDMDTTSAVLHIYRNSLTGRLLNYDLYLGDLKLARVRNNWKETVKVERFGNQTLWAQTEIRKEVPIYIEKGKEYYIRCGVSMGAMTGRPEIEVIDNSIGRIEYKSVEIEINTGNDHKEKWDKIILNDGREFICNITKETDDVIYFTIVRNGKEIETNVNKEKVQKVERAEK